MEAHGLLSHSICEESINIMAKRVIKIGLKEVQDS